MQYPNFIKKGDSIGVTAPSAGIAEEFDKKTLDNAKKQLEKMGFSYLETKNVRTDIQGRSSTGKERAEQFLELWNKEEVSMVMPSFTDVFPFKMLEGSADVLNERNQLLIPQSLARKLFGNESAIGKRLDTDFKRFVENGIYYVGGVFEDFPINSSVSNTMYCSIVDENKGNWQNWNYSLYILLDDPSSAEGPQ